MVVSINIKVNGMNELRAYLAELPKKVEKSIFSGCTYIMNDMLKNMKVMAPSDTGFLRSQLNIDNNGVNKIIINTGDAYYAIFQELGYASHFIPLAYFSQHALSPVTPGIPTSNTGGAFASVTKNKPFIEPAFNQAMANFNSKLNTALSKAIK